MRTITLMENVCYQAGLKAEHGFSLYIESQETKILFDTGQSSAFADNARLLGVDLSQIDHLVISHGHYDHTGGIVRFLQENSRATIWMHPLALEDKFNGSRYIGIDKSIQLPAQRVQFIEQSRKIAENITLLPQIEIAFPEDCHFQGMTVHHSGSISEDIFADEISIAWQTGNGVTVISGCAHRGISNTMETAKKFTGLPVTRVLGGFHLKGSSFAMIQKLADYFRKERVEQIGVSHCSGVEAYHILRQELQERVFYNHTGYEIQIDE